MQNYTFCPKCRSKLVINKDDARCHKCGLAIYNNPAPTVGVLPIQNGKVLLARRAIEPFKGKLDTIGGFLMNNELPEAGALREAKEETGLDMELIDMIGYFADIYEGDQYTISMNYVAKIKPNQSQPKADDDVASLHWVSIEDPPFGEMGFKNTREVLQLLKKWYKELK